MNEGRGNRTRTHGKKRRSQPQRSLAQKLSPAGARIVSAFEEALDAMRGGDPSERRLTVRTYHAEFVRPAYGPDDVRRVRSLLRMSQVVFSRFLGVEPNTVRSWEQGSRPPSAIARRFMGEIEADPVYWRKRVARSLVD